MIDAAFINHFANYFWFFLAFSFVRLIVLSGGIHFVVWLTPLKKRKVYDIPIQKKQYVREIITDLINISFTAFIVALMVATGWARLKNQYSFTEATFAFLLLFFWYEIMFYYGHRSFHHQKLFWMHRHHHQSVVSTSWTVLSFSLLEMAYLQLSAFSLVFIYSFVTPFPAEIMLLYFMINAIWNTACHCNYELLPKNAPGLSKFAIGATFHGIHHTRQNGNYGLFTTFLDHIHKTKIPDYEKCLTRIWNHKSFTSVNEKP
jgi:sterol desaturase/sphingolipid hydroxylase (fatty acid hydroxylase superfamily)